MQACIGRKPVPGVTSRPHRNAAGSSRVRAARTARSAQFGLYVDDAAGDLAGAAHLGWL